MINRFSVVVSNINRFSVYTLLKNVDLLEAEEAVMGVCDSDTNDTLEVAIVEQAAHDKFIRLRRLQMAESMDRWFMPEEPVSRQQ